MKAALYLRVSTDRQDVENQRLAIEEHRRLEGFAEGKDYEVVRVYKDIQSGADDGRLGFQAMLHDARRHKWDVLLFWSWDRLTRRGIGPAFTIMSRLEQAGVQWESINEPFLSSTAPRESREVILAIVAWVAKIERLKISERTKAGLARRRALGHHLGRLPGRKDRRPRTIRDVCRICSRERMIYRKTKRCRKCAIQARRMEKGRRRDGLP